MDKEQNFSSIIILTLGLVGFTNPPVAKNMHVPPKEEWRICETNAECTSRVIDCSNVGGYVALNKRYLKEDDIYFKQKCRERIKEGEVEILALRGGPLPTVECIQQKCEVVPDKSSEEQPSHFEKLKNWFYDLF